jgi:hypothetical protein
MYENETYKVFGQDLTPLGDHTIHFNGWVSNFYGVPCKSPSASLFGQTD